MNIRTSKQSPNYNKGRGNWKPDIIVCHISEGYYDSGCDWLCNPKSQASTHFFVSKKGEVSQLVDIRNTAWGNATTTNVNDSRYYGKSSIPAVVNRNTSANSYTISIEHEGFYKDSKGSLTEAQLSATVELIKHISNQVKAIYGFNIPFDREHIVGHCDIAPKWKPNCPGQNFPFNEVLKRLNQNNIAPSTPKTNVTPTGAYKVSESNLKAMTDKGIISSPDYWRNVTNVEYLDLLLSNAAKDGVCDKRIDNGITDFDIALDVLIDANVVSDIDYWKKHVKNVQYLDMLIINIANKCRIVIEKIVHAEAQGEGLTGQEMVANVVLNRHYDNGFPKGIYNVVFQKSIKNGTTIYQFSPIGDGAYKRAIPSVSVKSAITNVLNGKNDAKGALFFCSKTSASKPGNWHESALTFLFEHGNHRFYKSK